MPFLNSARGVYSAASGVGTSAAVTTNYQILNMTAYGSATTVGGSGTTSVSAYRSSGNGSWNTGAYSQNFTPPFTLEFQKQGDSGVDSGNAYAMVGIVPNTKVGSLSGSTNNYQYGMMWYPVHQQGLEIYETLPSQNPTQTTNFNYGANAWTPSVTVFRISIDLSGIVSYYNGTASSASRTVSVGTGYTWSIHYAGYAGNILSQAYNMKVNQNRLWNPATQKYYVA